MLVYLKQRKWPPEYIFRPLRPARICEPIILDFRWNCHFEWKNLCLWGVITGSVERSKLVSYVSVYIYMMHGIHAFVPNAKISSGVHDCGNAGWFSAKKLQKKRVWSTLQSNKSQALKYFFDFFSQATRHFTCLSIQKKSEINVNVFI